MVLLSQEAEESKDFYVGGAFSRLIKTHYEYLIFNKFKESFMLFSYLLNVRILPLNQNLIKRSYHMKIHFISLPTVIILSLSFAVKSYASAPQDDNNDEVNFKAFSIPSGFILVADLLKIMTRRYMDENPQVSLEEAKTKAAEQYETLKGISPRTNENRKFKGARMISPRTEVLLQRAEGDKPKEKQ